MSVIIPNKNKADLLKVCIEGLIEKTSYKNIEIIIVDNGSTDPETLALYKIISGASCKIINFDENFNYSRACNLGAAASPGELLLFLNNDMEVIDQDWLVISSETALEPKIGVVGRSCFIQTDKFSMPASR